MNGGKKRSSPLPPLCFFRVFFIHLLGELLGYVWVILPGYQRSRLARVTKGSRKQPLLEILYSHISSSPFGTRDECFFRHDLPSFRLRPFGIKKNPKPVEKSLGFTLHIAILGTGISLFPLKEIPARLSPYE
jgi:hypothetical protein